MINHFDDLTTKERILLHEIIQRNKRCETDIEFDVLSSVRQEFAVHYLKTAIENQLNEGKGLDMAKEILSLIES